MICGEAKLIYKRTRAAMRTDRQKRVYTLTSKYQQEMASAPSVLAAFKQRISGKC